jgi:predicted enzyme related to lactoylglutathione lyase
MESSLVHLTGAALRKETPVENMIKGLCWLGARADRYDDMKHFCHQVLGLALDHEEPDFVAFKLPDGSVVEVFGPSDEEHAYFGTGPVAGFEVDDIEAARARLEGAGVEFYRPDSSVGTHESSLVPFSSAGRKCLRANPTILHFLTPEQSLSRVKPAQAASVSLLTLVVGFRARWICWISRPGEPRTCTKLTSVVGFLLDFAPA